MDFIGYDDTACDCVDRDEIVTDGTQITLPQEQVERFVVQRKRIDSNCCDICRKRGKDLMYIVPVYVDVMLIYCEDCYEKRSDYVKKLEEEYKELVS